MTAEKRRILRVTHATGPASCAEISRSAFVLREKTYRLLYELRGENLVVRKGRASYDVTKRGRRVLAEAEAEPESLFAG